MTIEHSSELKQAKLQTEAANETRKAARTKYFPQVSATAVGMVAYNPLINIKTQGGNLPVYNGDASTLSAATEFAYFPK